MAPETSSLTLESESPEQTEQLAELLGRALGAGSLVTLDGDLGTGKTCFVRGLARGLGIDEPISSPTYTLMHEYRGRGLTLFHFDAWMAGREAAFLEGGGAEWLHAGGVAVVEWGSRVVEFLPAPRLEVRLEHLGPERRRLGFRLVPAEGAGTGASGSGGGLERALAALGPWATPRISRGEPS